VLGHPIDGQGWGTFALVCLPLAIDPRPGPKRGEWGEGREEKEHDQMQRMNNGHSLRREDRETTKEGEAKGKTEKGRRQ